MTYRINNTENVEITQIIDGTIDQTTDLTLVGKNVSGYGEYLNENFVKLLENFASTTEPLNKITGQLWFDTSVNKLKVYDGTRFKAAGGSTVSSSQPALAQGDIWINPTDNQLYFYDGSDLVLCGPIYKDSQGLSGFTVETIIDTTETSRTVVYLWCAQTLIGIFSKESVEFTPKKVISGYPSTNGVSQSIKKGFNGGSLNPKFYVTSFAAENLVDELGEVRSPSNYMAAYQDTGTTGTVSIQNSTPLKLGEADQSQIYVDDAIFEIASNAINQGFRIKLLRPGSEVTALQIDTLEGRVGIFQEYPEYNLDVFGDARITGDLIVEGETVTMNTTIITSEDKNIELNRPALGDSTAQTDDSADGGGIILVGATDKTILYNHTNSTWELSENIDIPIGKEFRINGVNIINETTLGSSVVNSNLTSLGTLTILTVDGLRLDNNTLSNINLNGDIVLSPNGSGVVDVSSSLITNLSTPTESNHAANKSYVDTRPLGFALDITDISAPVDDNIALVCHDLYPENEFLEGSVLRVHCTIDDNVNPLSRFLKKFQIVTSGSVALATVARSTGTATVTTGSPHGYSTGNIVEIVCSTDSNFDSFIEIVVTGPSMFTYSNAGTNLASTPAVGTALKHAWSFVTNLVSSV
jgi:hypothetical protein